MLRPDGFCSCWLHIHDAVSEATACLDQMVLVHTAYYKHDGSLQQVFSSFGLLVDLPFINILSSSLRDWVWKFLVRLHNPYRWWEEREREFPAGIYSFLWAKFLTTTTQHVDTGCGIDGGRVGRKKDMIWPLFLINSEEHCNMFLACITMGTSGVYTEPLVFPAYFLIKSLTGTCWALWVLNCVEVLWTNYRSCRTWPALFSPCRTCTWNPDIPHVVNPTTLFSWMNSAIFTTSNIKMFLSLVHK